MNIESPKIIDADINIKETKEIKYEAKNTEAGSIAIPVADMPNDTLNNTPNKLDKISYYTLLGLVFILPFFYIANFPLALAKSVLITVATGILLVLWVFGKLREGRFNIPLSIFSASTLGILVVTLISAWTSGAVNSSLFGNNFDVGTAMSIVTGLVLMYLTYTNLKTKDRIFAFYFTFFISLLILVLLQIARMTIGPDFLTSIGFVNDMRFNLIGSVNELGIFLGIASVVSFLTLEFLPISRVFNILSGLVLFFSMILIALIGFDLVMTVIFIIALLAFIYKIIVNKNPSIQPEGENKKFSISKIVSRFSFPIFLPSLLVMIFTLSFVFFGNNIRAQVGKVQFMNRYLIGQQEFFPTWTHTFSIAGPALKKDPLFGVGPNQFLKRWYTSKPEGVNLTDFWNADFHYGRGLIPTYLITTGSLGLLMWLIFFAGFIYLGSVGLFRQIKDRVARYLIISSFASAAYLWIFQVMYVPGPLVFVLAFAFTGVFLASLNSEKIFATGSLNFSINAKLNFIFALLLIIVLVLSLGGIYLAINKSVASKIFFKGVIVTNTKNDLEQGDKLVRKALDIEPLDMYYRFLIDLQVNRINAIIADKALTPDDVRAKFQPLFQDLLVLLQKATDADPSNYANWMIKGQTYAGSVTLQYAGAYEKAMEAFAKAREINPLSPAIPLEIARLELSLDKYEEARKNIADALRLKSNYVDAVYLLTQTEVKAKNIKGAIQSAEATAFLTPNEPTAFFQLGFLKYSDKDYTGAIQSLEKAISLNPVFSNARYFLGLSYSNLGRYAEATAQFEEILKYNPDNKEIQGFIKNLQAGKPALVLSGLSGSQKPESRKNPPVKEEN